MIISQLARTIGESATLKLNEEAATLRARGEPVIHLGGGEPKGPAPFTALLSSAAKLNTGDIKYAPTDGLPSLKKAILRYTEENYGRLVATDNVIVSTGAKQALFNTLFAILNPQDEVIILAPYWVSYPEMVKMMHAIPVIVRPPDDTFIPNIEDIEEAIGSYTRAIIVNSPNNPSGAVYPEELIAALVELCEARGLYLIMDDIYHKLVFDHTRVTPAYSYSRQDMDNSNIIVINGVSKLYGMTGFRIGWAVAARELVEVMDNVQVQTTSCPAVVSQAAAEGALLGVQNGVEALRLTIQNNRDVMFEELSTFTGVQITKPLGTFYCLPDFSAYNPNSVALSTLLLKKALVVTVPGQPFGAEGHLRLSYTGTIKEIREGLKRIKWALDPDAPNEIYIGDRKLVRDWM
jgi:aspartate aminotransferase